MVSRYLSLFRSCFGSRPVLLVAFMMTVMADPVSSVSYAIQAALEALNGNLGLLLQTMGLVIAVIVVVVINYSQLVARFPEGGGAAAATGQAFGEAWAFVPMGALIVDFALTIAISVAAGASAIVAYLPALAPLHIVLALILLLFVASISWYGHSARSLFGGLTILFIVLCALLLVAGAGAGSASGSSGYGQPSEESAFLAVLLAFPVAMALATGIEAPSSAIAQLGQLDDEGRKRFGRLTLLATLLIVGSLTSGISALTVRLGVGLPSSEDTTMLAELARLSVGNYLFAAFQAITALLLLAAAASSLQAGPGLLKALAHVKSQEGEEYGILPSWLGRTNRYYTPYWGVALFWVLAAGVVAVARANEQSIVLFYAVAVFVSFLAGLASMTRLSYQEGKHFSMLLNGLGTLVVFFVVTINLLRVYPLVSLSASLLIALGLYLLWVKSGRPRGVSKAAAEQ